MFGTILNLTFNAIILLLSIRQFYAHEYFGAVALLLFGILRLTKTQNFSDIVNLVIKPTDIERKSNAEINISIDVEKIISHPIFDHIFKKLPNELVGEDINIWRSKLVENYKTKTNSKYAEHCVRYHIRNGILYRNKELAILDAIYEEVLIPTEVRTKEPHQENELKANITLRYFVVNGSLRIEIGRFDVDSSPEVFQGGYIGKYIMFSKVTDFPFMYIGWKYGIPSKYLKPNIKACDYYKERFVKGNSKASQNDWRELKQDLDTYTELVLDADSPLCSVKGIDQYLKTIYSFQSKAYKWLVKEKYLDPNEKDDESDYSWRWEDGSKYFRNDYLRIEFGDWNTRQEVTEDNMYADWWEDRP